MSSKPTRLSRFPLPELFFVRLPSSSSLILASLVVSLSSPSALSAPVGDGPEDSSSYARTAVLLAQQHAPIPPSSDDTITQANSKPPVAPTITSLSLTPPQIIYKPVILWTKLKVTAPLLVLPELGKAIPDILHAILDPLVGKNIPKAQGKTLDLVKNLVPPVKRTWAEVDEGDDAASEKDLPMRPSSTGRRSRLCIQTRLSPVLILLPVF